MTKTLKLILAGSLAALTMMAADATGKWTAETPGRDGNTMTITMNLKADGDKLTGTVSGRRGDSDISNGKIDGDNVTFDVVREFNGNTMTTHYNGKLDGDTIHFTIKMEGGMGGGQGRRRSGSDAGCPPVDYLGPMKDLGRTAFCQDQKSRHSQAWWLQQVRGQKKSAAQICQGSVRDNRNVAFEREVALAAEMAEEAGALALEYQRRGLTPETKEDESPVTAADRACEKLIVERIGREFPEDGVSGEEGANQESRNGRKWIVDPIDGTRDFVRGIPLWAVLIGFEQDGEVVAGAAHCPCQQLLLVREQRRRRVAGREAAAGFKDGRAERSRVVL